jgi:TetR/AcrR family transcriptional repressor of nem operon
LRETIIGNMSFWASLLTDALDEAATNHRAVGHDSEATAWLLIDAYEGAALRGRATSSRVPMDAFFTIALPRNLRAFTDCYTA